ncbi:MAG: hypothetical protein GDA51_06085 [Ekhidna sp.]|nr:hypothetical protein [Ekhidna sp.]
MKVALISLSTMAPFLHQNTSASVSESCGRVESLSQGIPSSKNKSECFAKAERTATMLSSLF